MKAVGYARAGPIEAPDALLDFTAEDPTPGPHDLLVEVRGVSVNPVDTKLRAARQPEPAPGILGYDAAGVVREVGAATRRFQVGDAVFYAGDIMRPGTNAALHVVDERIVGRKPESLDYAEAAGLPLTAITAWEMLFDCFGLAEGAGAGESLLVVGAAGGVGSILVQLAKRLTGLEVIATASRAETRAWVQRMGADQVIDHHAGLAEQVAALGRAPGYVAALTGTGGHLPALIELVRPRGHIAVIDDPEALDILPGKAKALSFSWEFMFARPLHGTPDLHRQHELLNRVSALLDAGTLRSTVTANLGPMSAATLTAAHVQQESGRVIGKNVLEGF